MGRERGREREVERELGREVGAGVSGQVKLTFSSEARREVDVGHSTPNALPAFHLLGRAQGVTD